MSRIIGSDELGRKIPFSGMQIRRMEAAGEFPRRIKLNPEGRSVGWLESEIDAWIEARAAARDPEQVAA